MAGTECSDFMLRTRQWRSPVLQQTDKLALIPHGTKSGIYHNKGGSIVAPLFVQQAETPFYSFTGQFATAAVAAHARRAPTPKGAGHAVFILGLAPCAGYSGVKSAFIITPDYTRALRPLPALVITK